MIHCDEHIILRSSKNLSSKLEHRIYRNPIDSTNYKFYVHPIHYLKIIFSRPNDVCLRIIDAFNKQTKSSSDALLKWPNAELSNLDAFKI